MNMQSLPEADVSSPFHPGEREVQLRAGVREEAEKRGQKMLTAELAPKQREFFQQSPFIVTGHCDEHGQPWAGLITGTPGFMKLEENSNQASIGWSSANNITKVTARPGNSLGMLGIEFESRRRNRLNATVFANDEHQWRMIIDQGYGNCPKYIQQRPWQPALFETDYRMQQQTTITAAMKNLISKTDTFFIASSSGPEMTGSGSDSQSSAWGADISHRGGESGFLQLNNGSLTFEDYPGNNLFNTIGNLQQYPYCGLLIIDFSNGELLQIAGKTRVEHHSEGRRVHIDILNTRHWLKNH